MFQFKDLFQWDRFITPSIIKSFYWLVIVLIVLSGLSGVLSALAAMAISPFGGFLLLANVVPHEAAQHLSGVPVTGLRRRRELAF